jgi:hypothetical protein
VKERPFRLDLPLGMGSRPREVFGDFLSKRWPDVKISFEDKIVGMLHELWRSNDEICVLLMLHAHDGWVDLAKRRDVMAFTLEVEQYEDGVRPLRIRADKAAFPLLALDQAIRKLARDNTCRLEDVIAFAGRWLHAKGATESFAFPNPN